MPSYDEMLEYILDNGLECKCCTCNGWCTGIKMTPSGPSFPPCSDKDFGDLLVPHMLRQVYMEAHNNA